MSSVDHVIEKIATHRLLRGYWWACENYQKNFCACAWLIIHKFTILHNEHCSLSQSVVIKKIYYIANKTPLKTYKKTRIARKKCERPSSHFFALIHKAFHNLACFCEDSVFFPRARMCQWDHATNLAAASRRGKSDCIVFIQRSYTFLLSFRCLQISDNALSTLIQQALPIL